MLNYLQVINFLLLFFQILVHQMLILNLLNFLFILTLFLPFIKNLNFLLLILIPSTVFPLLTRLYPLQALSQYLNKVIQFSFKHWQLMCK